MDWNSTNLPEAWKKFRQHVELIFNGPLKGKDEPILCSYLMLWVGDKGRDIFNTWNLSADDSKKLNKYYEHFQAYVQPKLNPVFARYKFNNQVQGDATFDQFVTQLKLLAVDCSYTDPNEMIRDRIVFGVKSAKIREKLINEGENLTLEKAVQIGQNIEYSCEQLKTMNAAASEVHAVATGSRGTTRYSKGRNSHSQRQNQGNRASTRNPKKPSECPNCGRNHKDGTCPAKGKRCDKCGKWNHFASVCRSSQSNNNSKSARVNEIFVNTQPGMGSDQDSDFYVDTIHVDSGTSGKTPDQAFVNVSIGPNESSVRFKLDTGSQVNILPATEYNRLGIQSVLTKATKHLSAYSGTALKTLGQCKLKCAYNERSIVVDFFIVETQSTPILGMPSCLALELIQLIYTVDTTKPPLDKNAVLSEFSDVFKGVGKFKGDCSIRIDREATPVVNPPRRVPVALRDKLQIELERMEKAEVIVKVTEPTQWVNSLVIAEKPGSDKLRICLDPRDLNRAILRPHYPSRTLEDVLPKLAGARYFSKLDARSGYWAIKLDESSSFLTTFNTPFGRYRFLRMPFGIKCAQDEFQRKIDETFEDLPGVTALVDDILVYGTTRAEHDRNLQSVLLRSREAGIKLNADKLFVGLTEVPYFGHLLSVEGLKPDPSKISAIKEMEPPKNKGELETILGMVNYLAKFSPNLSAITAPMRQLLSKEVEFIWDQPQNEAFEEVKNILTSSPGPVLAYFDTAKHLTLQVDASKFGLGASLLQEGRPIAYASKSLTPTEVNYAQIEKELFAILFGCKRFHQYVYGRRIMVETDHKPLIFIMKKPMVSAPPRLQRMMLQLYQYDLELTHKSGKEIPLADTLSRKFLSDSYPELSEGMDARIHSVIFSIPISDKKLKHIQSLSDSDPQCVALSKVVRNGWPDRRADCPNELHEFWNYRDELSVINGMIFKGQKIFIPKGFRKVILGHLHTGHMGVNKCLKRARDILFWPKMSADIEDMVLKCNTCLERRYDNPREPLKSHSIPEQPWQVLASDLFSWHGQDFVLVVDYYSRYFEVNRLEDTRSNTVILKLKKTFSHHGIPEKLITDNGPQYSSGEFREFSKQYGFVHETSSPHHPQSNGLAEKTVQTIKHIFSKSQASRTDPYLGILEYLNTPLETDLSPAQLLMSRRLRSILPSTLAQLQPNVANHEKFRKQLSENRDKQAKYYSSIAEPLKPLQAGETVRLRRDGIWTPATITQIHNPRSYQVQTPDGREYRRNRRQLLKTGENSVENVDPCLALATPNNHQFVHIRESEIKNSLPPTIHSATPRPTLTTQKTQPISQSMPESDHNSHLYTTRSGRVIKPPNIMNL